MDRVHLTGSKPASEDFGCFGSAAGVPSVFWNFGGFAQGLYTDPAQPQLAVTAGAAPGNHSSQFVPNDVEPALHRAVDALLTAAAIWLSD
jgi:hypothetical protein